MSRLSERLALVQRVYKRKYGNGYTIDEATAEVFMRGVIEGLELATGIVEERDGNATDSRN